MYNEILFFLIFNLSRQSQVLDNLMIFVTNYLIYLTILFILILAIFGKTKEKRAFLIFALGLPIAVLIIKIIHLFFFEARPFITYQLDPLIKEITDASFPSRHATVISLIAFTYTYFKSKWSLVLLIFMIWIGISRIYVGVHYPLDVLGSFVVGIISLYLAVQIKNLLKFFLLR